MEDVVLGANWAKNIGHVVTVDVSQGTQEKPSRQVITGILHSTRDEYDGADLTRTCLIIGQERVYIVWDHGDEAQIKILSQATP